MKRKLTAREWVLLALLGIIALVSGYILLYYNPMSLRRDAAVADAALYDEQAEAANLRVAQKRRMERELAEIFAADDDPKGLAPYDNLQPVMLELNSILAAAEDYSLSFGTVDGEERIVRRSISLSFTSGDYGAAKSILQKLHDSDYRCMLENLTVSLGSSEGSPVSVNSTIVFFEYNRKG